MADLAIPLSAYQYGGSVYLNAGAGIIAGIIPQEYNRSTTNEHHVDQSGIEVLSKEQKCLGLSLKV